MFASLATALPDSDPRQAASGRLAQVCALLRIAGACVQRRGSPGALEWTGPADGIGQVRHVVTAAGWPDTPRVIADAAHTAGSASPIRFAAAIPLPGLDDTVLFLWDHRPRSAAMAYRLLALATELCGQAALRRLLALQAHNRALFERAAATARIGVWSCTLPDLALTWTDGVYDIFELPRGSAIERGQALTYYTEESRRTMEELRSRAIAECGEFQMDAEIITARGRRRWMRLTGAVDSHNGVARRILGMKQDITEEKLLGDRTRYLAEFDVMTGLANRAQFQQRLDGLGAHRPGSISALLVVDLDGFKQVNDTHGHAAGDQYLKEAARRLQASCDQASLVARIGGDEFAVLLPETQSPQQAEAQAAALALAMREPVMLAGGATPMAASIGLAHWQGQSGDELFRQADAALYGAKATGRGTSQVFRP